MPRSSTSLNRDLPRIVIFCIYPGKEPLPQLIEMTIKACLFLFRLKKSVFYSSNLDLSALYSNDTTYINHMKAIDLEFTIRMSINKRAIPLMIPLRHFECEIVPSKAVDHASRLTHQAFH